MGFLLIMLPEARLLKHFYIVEHTFMYVCGRQQWRKSHHLYEETGTLTFWLLLIDLSASHTL